MSTKFIFTLSCAAVVLFAGTVRAETPFVRVEGHVDKRTDPPSAALAVLDLARLSTLKFVDVDLRVVVDGRDKYALLTTTEGAHRRFPLRCGPGHFGRQTMTGAVEYYFQKKAGPVMYRVSIYPGSRTTHPFNDVSCVKSQVGAVADLRVRGFYHVIRSETPDSVDIQLRPLSPRQRLRPLAGE